MTTPEKALDEIEAAFNHVTRLATYGTPGESEVEDLDEAGRVAERALALLPTLRAALAPANKDGWESGEGDFPPIAPGDNPFKDEALTPSAKPDKSEEWDAMKAEAVRKSDAGLMRWVGTMGPHFPDDSTLTPSEPAIGPIDPDETVFGPGPGSLAEWKRANAQVADDVVRAIESRHQKWDRASECNDATKQCHTDRATLLSALRQREAEVGRMEGALIRLVRAAMTGGYADPSGLSITAHPAYDNAYVLLTCNEVGDTIRPLPPIPRAALGEQR